MDYRVIDFKTYGDERGFLTPLEGNKEIPFDIKRIFYIYGTKGKNVVRGNHANRKTKFVLIMLAGSCEISIYDRKGNLTETVKLDNPNKGLYLNNMVWKEMINFSDNAVMLVVASELFDEYEYIDTYEEFLAEVKA